MDRFAKEKPWILLTPKERAQITADEAILSGMSSKRDKALDNGTENVPFLVASLADIKFSTRVEPPPDPLLQVNASKNFWRMQQMNVGLGRIVVHGLKKYLEKNVSVSALNSKEYLSNLMFNIKEEDNVMVRMIEQSTDEESVEYKKKVVKGIDMGRLLFPTENKDESSEDNDEPKSQDGKSFSPFSSAPSNGINMDMKIPLPPPGMKLPPAVVTPIKATESLHHWKTRWKRLKKRLERRERAELDEFWDLYKRVSKLEMDDGWFTLGEEEEESEEEEEEKEESEIDNDDEDDNMGTDDALHNDGEEKVTGKLLSKSITKSPTSLTRIVDSPPKFEIPPSVLSIDISVPYLSVIPDFIPIAQLLLLFMNVPKNEVKRESDVESHVKGFSFCFLFV
jgi:hypothetical protein